MMVEDMSHAAVKMGSSQWLSAAEKNVSRKCGYKRQRGRWKRQAIKENGNNRRASKRVNQDGGRGKPEILT